jgi:hypothetical protein
MILILIVILVILAMGGLPQLSGHSYGYAPSGILGTVLVVILILFLLGRL